jgi:hypothetical protein
MRDWQAERRSNEWVIVLVAEDQDSLGLKGSACSTVAAGALHEVILLGDCGDLRAPYDPALDRAE